MCNLMLILLLIVFLLCGGEVVVKLAEAFYCNSRADSCRLSFSGLTVSNCICFYFIHVEIFSYTSSP